MKTTKEILSENRDSIISSIKWIYKVYKKEDIKSKMEVFLNWALKNEDEISRAYESKKTKTLLKSFIQNIHRKEFALIDTMEKDNKKWYELAEDYADKRGLCWDSRTGNMYKI